MLEFGEKTVNNWTPPPLREEDIKAYCREIDASAGNEADWLIIFQITPFIDSLYVQLNKSHNPVPVRRFVFREGYQWNYEDEKLFEDRCLNNPSCAYRHIAIDEIFTYYANQYPEWNLNRYYTKSLRLLDHIYHCCKKGTVKEILYKAGLDELAFYSGDIEEVNLLASRPSELFDGISIKLLRILNCREGAMLLATANRRAFLKELQFKFPGMFQEKFNDAQCRYLYRLIEGDLTVGETGRLFRTRQKDLFKIWNLSQYEMFIWKVTMTDTLTEEVAAIKKIDPIYEAYLSKVTLDPLNLDMRFQALRAYLLYHRKEYDAQIRRANRKREYDWQERDGEYIVRFPQTINDFCREAIYMGNCLLTYVEALINNDTTILFLRDPQSCNQPFITIEIFANELMQAYHRFNKDCSLEEAVWIKEYCKRHGIRTGKFKFDRNVDELF